MGNQTYFPQKDTFFVECAFRDQELYKIVSLIRFFCKERVQIMKDLRFLRWKINNFSMDVRWRDGLRENLRQMSSRVGRVWAKERQTIQLEAVLLRYYEKPDVEEILSQYLGPLRVQL